MQARYAQAEALYRQALPLYREIGDRLGEAHCLYSWGRLAASQQNLSAADEFFTEAAQIYESIGLADRAKRATRRMHW
jgi:tetratricopeptide (TPR) repeat protein